MKTREMIKGSTLTKVYNDEKPLKADGEIAQVETRYALNCERTKMVNMTVMKFNSAEKAMQFFDDEENSRKSKDVTPVRGKKATAIRRSFSATAKGR